MSLRKKPAKPLLPGFQWRLLRVKYKTYVQTRDSLALQRMKSNLVSNFDGVYSNSLPNEN
jgi:hypothetical protein